jgi:uncharacterized membrane protein
MISIIGMLAFIALIAILTAVSDSAEAGPILSVDIENGVYQKEVEPGKSVHWQTSSNDPVISRNLGDADAIDVNITVLSLPQYWSASITPSNFDLSQGSTQRSKLSITAPSNATHNPTGHSITIQLEWGSIIKTTEVTVTVKQIYSVGLSPDATPKSGDPGSNVFFSLTVSNLGNGDDTINMTVAGERPGWNCYFNSNSVTVFPFSDATIQLTCYISPDELKGNYPISVTATSENPSKSQTINIQIDVNQTYGVTLSTSPTNKDILPDETINYSMTLHNDGNGDDDFTLVSSGLPAGWTISFPPSINGVAADADFAFTVFVTAHPDALKNELATIYVNATTGGLAPKTYSQQITARVLQVFKIDLKGITLSRSMAPEGWGIYTVNITNKGNGVDTINLDVNGLPLDWPVPNFDSSVELNPNEWAIMEINVTTGVDALNQPYYFTIDTASFGDPTKTNTKTGTASITETHLVSVIILESTKFAEPEQTIFFTIQVGNDGNGVDDILMDEAGVPAGWVTVFSKKTIQDLKHGNITEITFWVTPSEDAQVGPNLITIYGNSSEDGTAFAFDTINVQIKQVYKIVVNTADNSNTVIPFSTTTYNLTLRNDGTGEDTFELSYDVDPGQEHVLNWISLEDPAGNPLTSITLTADQEGYVILKVVVPTVAGGGEKGFYNITLTASSLGNTSVSASKTTITQIIGVYDIFVSASVFKGEAAPGNDVIYEVFVQNVGTESDNFDINASGIHSDWVSFDISPPWVFLNPDDYATINVTISIPDTWTDFGSFDTQIIATSRSNNTVEDSLLFNTTITEVHDVKVESPAQFKAAEPDQNAYFEVRVWNEGTAEDVYTISIADTEPYKGWVTFPNGTLLTIPAGTFEVVNVTVLVDGDANVGEYIINITATSEDDDAIFDILDLTVDVQQIYKVKIRAYDDNIDGDPNTDIIYVITVWNEGNGDDTIEISADSSWVTEIEQPTVELGPGDSITFNVTVHIPNKQSVGDYKINLTAISSDDPVEFNETELINVKVNPIYEFIIDGLPSSAGITPGTSENFTITVENKGTGDDTILFNIEGINRDWAKIYNNSIETYQIFVPKGAKITMTMVISVPLDELKSTGILFIVNASSQESVEAVFDTFDFIIDVDQSYDGYVSTNDPSQTTDPGEYVEFTLQIHNEGNDIDSFLMSVENKLSGWTYKFDGQDNPTIGPISEGTLATSILRVTVDAEEVQGTYFIVVRATSQGDASVFFNTTLTIIVDQKFEVELQGSGSINRDVEIEGGSTSFFVKVYNRGNGPDNLGLTIESEQDYWVEISHTDVSPAPNDFVLVTVWINISSRAEWESKGSPGDLIPISIKVIVETPGDPSPTLGENTRDELDLSANPKDIYGLYADVSPSFEQEVEIGSSVTFDFIIHNTGTTGQQYRVTTMDYNPTHLNAPTYSPSQSPFPTSTVTGDTTLSMTVTPKSDGLEGKYEIRIRIVVHQDDNIQYFVNVNVTIKPNYDVQLRAQNDETNKETLVNTYANYTLYIKNLGNTIDTFTLGSVEPYSQLVSFAPKNITLDPDETGTVICSVFADQAIIEANNLYSSGIPSSIRVASLGDIDQFATLSLDTDITVTHALFLSSPDDKKDIAPGESGDFILYVENTGTTNDKYVSSVVSYNTEALDNPTFNPPGTFPASPVSAGTSTSLDVHVEVLTVQPTVPVGDYWMVVRISIDGFPAIYQDYNFTIQVKQVYTHTVETDDNRIEADVNEFVNYTIELKNKGNGPETFEIVPTGTYATLVTVEMSEVTLDPEEFITISVQVFTNKSYVDRDDLYGFDLETPIKVTSKNDPDSFNVELILYTEIKFTYDFELSSLASGNKIKGEPGETLDFKLEVTNIGTAVDRYNLKLTGTHPSIFPSVTVSDINQDVGVQQSRETSVFIEISSATDIAVTGEYDIIIRFSSQAEPSLSKEITIYVNITNKAGLEMDSSQTGSEEPGESIDYKFKITNKGNAPDTFELALEGENSEWGQILDSTGTNVISELTLPEYKASGHAKDIIVRVTIPTTGETTANTPYPIDLVVTSRNDDDETLTRQATTTVKDYVELELDYIGSGTPAKNFDPNQKTPKFSFRVTNNGNQPESDITILVDPADWSYTPDSVIEDIDPAGSATFNLEFTIPTDEDTGEYELEVYVQSSIDATVKSDSVFIKIFIIKPDLSVSSGDIDGLDDTDYLLGRTGSAVTVFATIHNEGDADAKSVQVRLYEESTLKGTKSISTIVANGSKTVDFRWTVPAEEVELRIEITPQEEIGEDNNKVTIRLDLRPDLSFTGEQINFSKADPQPGDKITLTAYVYNSGGDAEDVTVKFYDGNKPISGGVDTIDIDHDETGEATIEWTVPDKDGESISIRAELDAPDMGGDGDDVSRSLTVGGSGGVDDFFSLSGIIMLIIGFMIGAILLFFVGRSSGRSSSQPQAQGPQGMAGPSFAAFEKEMPEGADKAAKGPMGGPAGPAAGPAPFERMEEEGGAPPSEEEEKAKPKEAARVRCPKCGRVMEVTSTQRPLQIPCECGTTLMLKK